MTTLAISEAAGLLACFVYALGLLAARRKIRIAALGLFGALVVWFVIFCLAVPEIRSRLAGSGGGLTGAATMEEALLFVGVAAAYSTLFAISCSLLRWLYRCAVDWWELTPKLKRTAEIAGFLALVIAVAVFGWRAVDARAERDRHARETVAGICSAIPLGAGATEVEGIIAAAKDEHLELKKNLGDAFPGDGEVWEISTPFMFGTEGRALYVQFDTRGRAAGVAMRTLDSVHRLPEGAPPDKGVFREPQ